MGGEDDDRALWYLVGLLNEDRATLLKSGDHVLVMDDLLADIDRCAVEIKRLLNCHDCAVDTCAITTRGSEQDTLRHSTILLGSRNARNFDRCAATCESDL